MKKIWIDGDKFKSLNENEVAALEIEQLAAYKTDESNHKIDKLKESIEAKAEKDDEEFQELKKSFDVLQNGHIKTLEEQLVELGLEVAKNRKKSANESANPLDLKQAMNQAWAENADKIKSLSNNEAVKLNIELKTEVTRASVSGNTMAFDIPGVGKLPVRRIFMEDLFMSGTVGSNNNGVIRFWDQNSQTRNAAAVAESGTIPESEIDWIERTQKIEKIADSIPVTEEALADVDFIRGELNNFLLENVNLKLDRDLLLGTGVSPILEGVDSFAQAYAAGAFANKVDDANIFDVVSTAMVQVANNGENSFFAPNAVLMNPTDIELARLTKDSDGNYIIPMWLSTEGNTIKGVRVIENKLVVQNTLYVGDFTKGTVWSTGGLSLELANQHASDWLDDVIRMKARVRKSLVVRNLHQDAFVKVADIAAAQIALDPLLP